MGAIVVNADKMVQMAIHCRQWQNLANAHNGANRTPHHHWRCNGYRHWHHWRSPLVTIGAI